MGILLHLDHPVRILIILFRLCSIPFYSLGERSSFLPLRLVSSRCRLVYYAALFGPPPYSPLARFFLASSALRETRFQTAAMPMAFFAADSVARASSRMRKVPS